MKLEHRVSRLPLLLALLLLASASSTQAELTTEQLIRDAGLTEAPVAMRDLKSWSGARKVVLVYMPDDIVSNMRALLPGVEFVAGQSPEDVIDAMPGADALVGTCERELVDAADSLVWVQVPSAGVEHCLDNPAFASGKIVLSNGQKLSSPVLGEHAVALALALARQLPVHIRNMRSGAWDRNSGAVRSMVPLSGRTMLVAGLGGIGTEVARRGAALGMRVIGTRNSSREGPPFVDYVGLSDELFALAAEADVVVDALPLTDATEGLFDERFFAAVKPGAIFVNVGRGGTVDTAALLAALEAGRISGAGLDVTDPEPLPPDHALWQRDDVIITPHVAGRGDERVRHALLLVENLRRYAAGDALLNVVDPERGY